MSSNNSIFFALCSSILLSVGVLSLKCLESDEHVGFYLEYYDDKFPWGAFKNRG